MENNPMVVETVNSIDLEKLISEVIETTINPQDKYEIAAILESIGWNDARAAEHFGVEDIFELSELIWYQIQENVRREPIVPDKKSRFIENLVLILNSFIRGLVFALPMIISVISMLTLRLSLWSYKYLSTELATSIAIGTILSFMSVGGFMQAIAVKGFTYLSQDLYKSAQKVTFFILKKGYLLCLIVAIIYTLFNMFYYNFTGKMLFVIIAYYLCLSSLWLSVTVIYILKRQFTFTILITSGIGVVYVLFHIAKLNIIISQLIALIVVAIVGLMLVVYFFKKDEHKNEKNISISLPQMSILLYSVAPFFAYGFLYFTFLFIDRILAWSTDNFYMPYIIWFRGDYELGLDFALFTLAIPLGMSEVIVVKFMEMIQTSQRNSILNDYENITKRYLNTYMRSMLVTFSIAAMSAIISYMVVIYISNKVLDTNYLNNSVTYFVFVMALVSYSILALALTNTMILLSLSQPRKVTKVMFWSLAINFLSGFVLSRWFGYEFAVLGLMVGTISFFIGSCYFVIKILKELDYYLYYSL